MLSTGAFVSRLYLCLREGGSLDSVFVWFSNTAFYSAYLQSGVCYGCWCGGQNCAVW